MNESRSPFSQFKLWAHVKLHVATTYRNYLDTLPSSVLLLSSGLDTYKLGSITFGIGLISVPSSCSIRCRLKRSSYVIRLIAIPKWPNLPDRPIRCRYVSAIFGKSKLITTFTAWTSIPRVNRSLLTCKKKEKLRFYLISKIKCTNVNYIQSSDKISIFNRYLRDFGIILHGNHGIRDSGAPAPFSRVCNNSNIQDPLFF